MIPYIRVGAFRINIKQSRDARVRNKEKVFVTLELTLESAAASHIEPTPGLVTGIFYVGRRLVSLTGISYRYRGFPRPRKRYAAGIPRKVSR